MKDNTSAAKGFLQRAIHAMPGDFTLSEVRYHLKTALAKIEQVEKRRERRHLQEQKQYEQNWGPANGNVRELIDQIDEMIAEEKDKLERIAERRRLKSQLPEEEGDGTLLG